MTEPLKWYDEKADNSPWITALAEVRQRATRESYCYQPSDHSGDRSIR
ncbi:hypothetical protein V1286_005119 [Bradyrhizobium algeriense]|uniref:Uncharacterized protein n=1 Tax=Bradyrhizobium algeriense TaxID=634784 RepID=A0ABU8BGB1_9BRAD